MKIRRYRDDAAAAPLVKPAALCYTLSRQAGPPQRPGPLPEPTHLIIMKKLRAGTRPAASVTGGIA